MNEIRCGSCQRILHPTDERQLSLTGLVRCLKCVEWEARERNDRSDIMARFDDPDTEIRRGAR